MPFCLSEPRLKGSFRLLEPIYKEVAYVLHQIIDRMDNTMSLRQAYGSSVLEELHPHVYAHRRNVAASITLTLSAVREALTNKLPLPQYLPSCRQAHIRLVYRVREVLAQKEESRVAVLQQHGLSRRLATSRNSSVRSLTRLDEETIRRVTEPKLLSWNAAAAGQMEIIEYLEELVELTKLLVGVNAFRGGMLDRSSYRYYMQKMRAREATVSAQEADGTLDVASVAAAASAGGDSEEKTLQVLKKRLTGISGGKSMPAPRRGSLPRRSFREERARAAQQQMEDADDDLDALPASLKRVGTRIREERSLTRRMTMEDAGKGKGVKKKNQERL